MTLPAGHLVGRARELDAFERLLVEVEEGQPQAVVVTGEPGIGKTRLLAEVAARADARRWLVLAGSASELERDLPFSVFVDALDEYLRGLEAGFLSGLDEDVRSEIAFVFPSLRQPSPTGLALQHERYRTHRAVRSLLEHLAELHPLVLMLDDLHWADAGSVELLAALLRRPPRAAVLVTMALRPLHGAEPLALALEEGRRAGRLIRLELDALTLEEARTLLGEGVDASTASVLLQESGGNPFYLEQLARSLGRQVEERRSVLDLDLGVPPAVVSSLTEELGRVSEPGRLVLQGAAVAGDPFEPELAAAAAGTTEVEAMDGIDELLRLDLVRTTDVPRRFRFRHPLVRRTVYEVTGPGWRLGAHERCAEALAARGASAAERAHHVEQSARVGDRAAVAVLREAGDEAVRLAPESGARWFGSALRLLPGSEPVGERAELLLAQARALTAVGHLARAHDVLVDALALVPADEVVLRGRLTRACAGVESNLGRHEEARRRLEAVIPELPEGSDEAVASRIELAMSGFWRADYPAMLAAAEGAVAAARRLGDPPSTAAALAVSALAASMTGDADRADAHRSEAARSVDALSDGELARRLDAAAWLAGAELYLDRYVEADRHAGRALDLGRATGQGELFLVLTQILGRVWFVRGKLGAAADLLDGGVEAARLLGNTQALVWNLFNRSVVALAAGDLVTAAATARESVELSQSLDPGFHSAWAGVRLAEVLLERGDAEGAVELLLGRAGGEELSLIPGSWRAYCLELLTRCWLALDRTAEAEDAARRAWTWAESLRLPLAEAWAERALGEVRLRSGDPSRAADLALASTARAETSGARVEAALSRGLAGRALARCGRVDRAVAELERAAAELEAAGALRHRGQVERDLRGLGRPVHRRTRPGSAGTGILALTEREREVARLVVERRTNHQIAAELFVSQKTVETHLRNIFHKVGVSSRTALARAIEESERSRG